MLPKYSFAGQNIGEEYLAELQEFLMYKKFGIIVLYPSQAPPPNPPLLSVCSRSSLRPRQASEAAKNLIVAITDAKRGALRQLATEEGYRTFRD